MQTPRLARRLIAPLSVLLAGTGLPAWAQSLQELYDAARVYDAAYLSTKAAAQAAEHRAAQADALLRPSAALSGSASMGLGDAPRVGTRDTNALGATISGKYPLINRATAPTIEQSRKAVQLTQADLEAVEQDLIVRLSQAYFDVLAAQDALTTTPARPSSACNRAWPRSRPWRPQSPHPNWPWKPRNWATRWVCA